MSSLTGSQTYCSTAISQTQKPRSKAWASRNTSTLSGQEQRGRTFKSQSLQEAGNVQEQALQDLAVETARLMWHPECALWCLKHLTQPHDGRQPPAGHE